MGTLQSGHPLPPLELQRSDGSSFEQEKLLGSPTILYFMRSAACGICLSHVLAIGKKLERLGKTDVQVFVVIPEEPDAVQKVAARVPFPVLSGAYSDAHQAVGLGQRVFGAVQASGSMVLGRDAQVVYVKRGTLPPQAYDEAGLFGALEGVTSFV